MPPRTRVSLRVQGGLAMQELTNELKAQSQKLPARLRSQVRTAGAPVIADLRRAVMTVQVESDRGGFARPDLDTGLRKRVAAALTTSITRNGIRIRVNGKRVDPRYGNSLPRYLDASLPKYQRWRHPVFGNTYVWVMQRGQPWFFNTIMRHAKTFRLAVLAALDETIKELKGRR